MDISMELFNLINAISEIFWDKTNLDEDVANEVLDLLDNSKEIVQFSSELTTVHRELSIWSRTEEATGETLDLIESILGLTNKQH